MYLIINADDFGMSKEVNHAIRNCFYRGMISSTSLLVNMPGFEEAVQMIKEDSIFQNRVGIHLNLFEGVPLTSAMKENLLYCNEHGMFRYLQGHISFLAPRSIARTIVYDELKAQIVKALDSGLIPTHLDSHAHYHSNWFVGKTVIDLAKEFHIPYIRTSPNLADCSRKKHLINCIFNRRRRLSKYGLKKCDYMGNVVEIEKNLSRIKGWCEMMIHPTTREDGVIIDAEFQKPLDDLLAFLGDIAKYSYCDIKNFSPEK